MKELLQYREEHANGSSTFTSPNSPHYGSYIEAMKHRATADHQTVAVCCRHSSTYQLIRASTPELQAILPPTMTFEQFELLICASDQKHTVDARKLAYQFAEGLTASEAKSYTLAFECRLRFGKQQQLRTLLKYSIDINGADTQSHMLLLQLLPLDIGENLEISEGVNIVDINTRRVVHSNGIDQLTAREMEVIKLVKKGLSSPKIADMLFISTNTVNNHRRSVLTKTQTASTDIAVRYLEFAGVV